MLKNILLKAIMPFMSIIPEHEKLQDFMDYLTENIYILFLKQNF
jgi:hypothetical protein